MDSGSIAGLFATTVGGVPKPRVDTLDVTTLGIRHEIIRDKKHHGGTEKAVCLMSVETMELLQSLGHPNLMEVRLEKIFSSTSLKHRSMLVFN